MDATNEVSLGTSDPAGFANWPYFAPPPRPTERDLAETHVVYMDEPTERPLRLGHVRFKGWLAFETLDHEPQFVLGGRRISALDYSFRPDVAIGYPSYQTRGWQFDTTVGRDMLTPHGTLEMQVLIEGTEVFFQSFTTLDVDSEASPSPFVTFMHIPKTGGTTLRRSLHDSGLKVREAYEPELSEEALKDDSMQVLAGHLLFGTHEFFSQPSTYVTVIRNPFERLASHYLHAQDNNSCNCRTLVQFAEEHPNESDNLITRYAAGLPWPTPLDAVSVEVACSNLARHFAVIGDTSNLELFRIRLQRYLGVQLPALTMLNARGSRRIDLFQKWDTRKLAEDVMPRLEHDWEVWYFVQRLIQY